MSDIDPNLLAQAQAIQQQNLAKNPLLMQASKIQKQKLAAQNTPAPQFSGLESAGIGTMKGLTGGLTGVAAGAGGALADTLGGGATQQSADESIGLRPDLASKPSKVPDYHPSYAESLNDQKSLENAAKAAHPIAFGASEIAGSIPSMMIGSGALKAAGVASPVAQGAILGGGTGLTNYLGQNANPEASGALESAGLGAGIGAAGGALGEYVSNKLKPEDLEAAGSKLASNSVGIKPSKELTTEWNEDTGQMESGSNIIKGIGKTLMNQGALPMTGGANAVYDSTLEAINKNYQQLAPIFDSTQQQLTPQLQNILADVKPVTVKTADLMQNLTDQIPDTSSKFNLMNKLNSTYQMYEQKLGQTDGNLTALNEIKRELQSGATDLAKNVYNQGSDASWEAILLKRMGGVVRQHIEDLANGADPGAGDQIHDLNSNIQLLNTALPYIKKLGDKAAVSIGPKDLMASSAGFLAGGPMGSLITEGAKLGTEVATGNPIGRLTQMGGAKLLNAASDVETPIGTIVQNAPKPVTLAATISPWSQEKAQNKAGVTNQYNTSPAQNVTRTASNLYNATNQSLDNVADELKRVAGIKYTADRLKQSIANNDSDAKNRAIFQIMQQPQARKLVTEE